MTDRELLTLAAKAAGWPVTGLAPAYMCAHGSDLALIVQNDRGGESVWNPLENDGDALRLAVRLNMDTLGDGNLLDGQPCVSVVYPINGDYDGLSEIVRGGDEYAAMRRAITRAAAAIGEKA